MDETASTGAALLAFLAATLGWMVFVGLLTAVILIAGNPGVPPAALQDAVSPELIGMSTALQATGLGAIALLLAWWLGPMGVAVRPFRWPWIPAAVLGGLTVGLLPSWIAQVLSELLPSGALGMLEKVLEDDGTLGRTLLFYGICFAAPLGEELAFRGYLWYHLERRLPPVAVWLVTSLLFASYHLDPVQSLALVPTALFLGWLRLTSGSIWPAVAGHFANNALAMTAMVGWISLPAQSPAMAIGTTVFTWVVCGGTWWLLEKNR